MCLQVCGSSDLKEEVVQALKSSGLTDLLFLALLVDKENSGNWMEALNMFEWLQKVGH